MEVIWSFNWDLPDEIPKSFDPNFIKAIKAAKKPKTAKRYICLYKEFIYEDNKNIS